MAEPADAVLSYIVETTHKVKGIVLRTVKYGETSVITTVYTDLFGLQSYIVKGARKSGKHAPAKAHYFQPGALLDLLVYKNAFKSLQYIKEFQWGYLYDKVFFDVVRNAVGMYMVELIVHSIKEEEAHPDMFDFFENAFILLDKGSDETIANLPLIFSIYFAKFLGFQIHGKYSDAMPYLDLLAGSYVAEKPDHPYVMEDQLAAITSRINSSRDVFKEISLPINHFIRRELLKYYQQFFSLHLQQVGEMKSIRILQAVLQ